MKKHKHSQSEKLFLCTGGLSKALFISLLISKLLKYTNFQCACFLWHLNLMILIRENPLLGPLEVLSLPFQGPKSPDLQGQKKFRFSGPKKSRFSGPPPSNGPRNGVHAP
jgi:hypothetical protein